MHVWYVVSQVVLGVTNVHVDAVLLLKDTSSSSSYVLGKSEALTLVGCYKVRLQLLDDT